MSQLVSVFQILTYENRLKAVTRLSSIVFEVTSPDFQKEQRTWRSRIVSVVNVFFSLLWSEDMVRRPSVFRALPHTDPGVCSRRTLDIRQMYLPRR